MMDDFFENLRQAAAGAFRQFLDDLPKHGLGDDQFAHHVHDTINSFQFDSGGGGGRFGGRGPNRRCHLDAFADRGCRGWFVGMQLRHQRRGDNVLFFNRRCGRTNAFRRAGKIGRRGRVNNLKIAIVDDELEDFVDLCAWSRRLQRTGPPDVRMIGFKLGQFGQAIQMCLQVERAQFAQIAENIERLVRLLQHLRLWPEGDRVSSHDICGIRVQRAPA